MCTRTRSSSAVAEISRVRRVIESQDHSRSFQMTPFNQPINLSVNLFLKVALSKSKDLGRLLQSPLITIVYVRYITQRTEPSKACKRCSRMAVVWPPAADYFRPGDLQRLERLGRQRWNGWLWLDEAAGIGGAELDDLVTSATRTNVWWMARNHRGLVCKYGHFELDAVRNAQPM